MGIETPYMPLFLVLLPVLAFMYASVGHGGASGYLALMALFNFPSTSMKQTALLLNLVVAGVAFYHFYRAGHFLKNLFLPFAIGSVPAAFVGGALEVEPLVYKKILGLFLVFAVVRIFWRRRLETSHIKTISFMKALSIGIGLGFFSGLIGIGGGILLTPIILLLHWGNVKEAAAVSALFIWVNSLSGLLGQFSSGVTLMPIAGWMVILAALGGLAGSYFGSRKWSGRVLAYCLGTVLVTASLKLLFF